MTDETGRPKRGISCPRCKGTKWQVRETRPQVGALVRIRTCTGCRLRVRTREVIHGAYKCRPVEVGGTPPTPRAAEVAAPAP